MSAPAPGSLQLPLRAPVPRACGFWWAIADYQPEPVVDATIPPAVGHELVIPSLRVLDIILRESRRRSA